MFQFPGFASKPLCIQGNDTCFSPLLTSCDDNNELSGGFPHSDIHGSKPIPGSPWLNAGYHVLHRLLLPRHPPNALFALDLIRKEQGSFPCQKHVHSHANDPRIVAVSCTRLGTISPSGSNPRLSHTREAGDTDVVSL
jgi:hypothetical protein